MFKDEINNLRAWLFGALGWLAVSVVVVISYLNLPEPRHLFELCGLMSLLWLEFGFAGIFGSLRQGNRKQAVALLPACAMPPLLLFALALLAVWSVG